jgi:hypothetical protein
MLDWPLFLLRFARDSAYDRLGYYPPRDFRTRYLSQFALAIECKACGGVPYVMYGGRPELVRWDSYRLVEEGDAVWIRAEDLGRFAREILPALGHRFVLVTGESDLQVPADIPEAAEAIVRSGLVTKWFTTNFDRTAYEDLITGLPLGLHHAKKNDWMGLLHPRGATRVDMKPFADQEAEWDAIRTAAPPIERRVPKAVADFHLNDTSRNRRYGESRGDIERRLRGNPAVVWLERNRRLPALLREYARHAFVISPHGKGLDCYRTWEALLMGCIPIVRRSAIDPLYRGLPVAIVDDWDEITPANLACWLGRWGSAFDRGKVDRILSSSYWAAQIRGHEEALSPGER